MEFIFTALCFGFPLVGVIWVIGSNIRTEFELDQLAERIFKGDK